MIKNLSQLNQTLGRAEVGDWSSKVGNNLEDHFNELKSSQVAGSGEAKTFGDFLQDSIGKVNAMQNDADLAMQKLASGESKDLHETLLAVEKAEIAFKAMNQVRSKVIDAYKEIMRMQI